MHLYFTATVQCSYLAISICQRNHNLVYAKRKKEIHFQKVCVLLFFQQTCQNFLSTHHPAVPVEAQINCKSNIYKFLPWLVHISPPQLQVFANSLHLALNFFFSLVPLFPSLFINSYPPLSSASQCQAQFPSGTPSFSSNASLSPSHCPSLQRLSKTTDTQQLMEKQI